jgi:pyridoxal 5'-phosphate synthase pdxT subunit
MQKIGILAIHGDVVEHADILRELNLQPIEVRAAEDFENLDGLILPGGESTTISDLAKTYGLEQALIKFAKNGKPILATCAGLILLAQSEILDIEIERNAYGRQLDSFETRLNIPSVSKRPVEVAFIRAPKITKVGEQVEILAKFENSPVLVQQKNIFGMSFHPEITKEVAIHKFIFNK